MPSPPKDLPFELPASYVGKVSDEYNLALQQARIHELPVELRVRMGQLMLKGWVFKLTGCVLLTDTIEDRWEATNSEGHYTTLSGTLGDMIERTERIDLP